MQEPSTIHHNTKRCNALKVARWCKSIHHTEGINSSTLRVAGSLQPSLAVRVHQLINNTQRLIASQRLASALHFHSNSLSRRLQVSIKSMIFQFVQFGFPNCGTNDNFYFSAFYHTISFAHIIGLLLSAFPQLITCKENNAESAVQVRRLTEKH